MILTSRKKSKEIIKWCEDDKRLFVLICGGCPAGAETADPVGAGKLKEALTQKGVEITGELTVDFLCNRALLGERLGRHAEELYAADRVLVLACGVGVQATASMVELPVVPGLDTVNRGGIHAKWPSEERCQACGECVIAWTGGICPKTTCSKGLLNGACGGTTDDGNCEVSDERPCGWKLIYDRLKELGRESDLLKEMPLNKYTKWEFPNELRTTTRWALEVDEYGDPAGAQAE